MKSKSLREIEERMGGLDPTSLRYQVLDSAKKFKSSWIELGQHLFTVYKDKLFKEWGYLTFEAYAWKEIGVRQATAMKLLKSYSFLENEEPQFLKRDIFQEKTPRQIPSFESVNALRLVKDNDRFSEEEYADLREEIFDEGKEDSEVKKKIRYILKSKISNPPKENTTTQKKLLAHKLETTLQNTNKEMAQLSFPDKIIKKSDELLSLVTDYIERNEF